MVLGLELKRNIKMETSCPVIVKGCSRACPATHVSIARSATRVQMGISGGVGMLCFVVIWMNGGPKAEKN